MSFMRPVRISRASFSRFLSFVLLLSFFTVPGIAPTQIARAATSDACQAGGSVQSSLRVTPSHGKAFYIDSGVTPKLDAGYVGYIVTNTSASARKGLWLQISDFKGGIISLANLDDQYMQLDDLGITGSGSESSTAYIMLKASGATTSSQSHVIRVFDKRPDLNGASELYSCTYAFSVVKETIKAASNTVSDSGDTSGTHFDTTTAAIDVSTTSPQLGENLVITVEGQPGQIGKGGVPDYDSIWLTPAAISSWPTRALKLVDVSITFEGGNKWDAADQVTYNDRLLITGTNGLANVDQQEYVARYTFRVVGNPGTNVKVVPVAQIASGTQMKHSDTGGAGATRTLNFAPVSVNYSLAKRATSTSNLETTTVGGNTYLKVPYEIKMTSTSATKTFLDEITDIPASAGIFDTGSARITDADRTNISIPDPTYVSTEANLNPRPIHFVGPFSITSSSPVILTYKLLLPAVTATYTNQAYAMVGDLKIGATASTIPQVAVNTTSGSTGITTETTTVTSAVEAITVNATDVDTKTATLNATIDPNGNGGTAVFQYGTSASLASFTEVTATSPASGTLTGSSPLSASYTIPGTLTPNTTYYFRIRVGTVYGDILPFTTSGVASPPTSVTLTADPVGTTTATLNGTVNPNFSSVLKISFLYKSSASVLTSADLNSGTEVDLVESGTATLMTATGGSAQPFSLDLTRLTNGTTYYFKIRACTALSGGNCSGTTYDGGVQSFTTGRGNQTITFNTITDKTYGDANFTISPTATSLLTVSLESLTPGVCTISGTTITIVGVGTCTIRATQAGNSSFNPAPTVDQSFTVNPKVISITADDKTKSFGDSTPTMTNTITGFVGSDSATIDTIVRKYTGKSVAFAESSTAPTEVGSYNIVLSAASLIFSRGSAANYILAYVDGTYTINDSVAQVITFNPLSSVQYGAATQTMSASANSGLTVTYSVSGPCTISGATVTITGVGTCSITASQSGGSNGGVYYRAATPVTRDLVITSAPLTITATTSATSKTYGGSNPTFGETHTALKYSDAVSSVVLTFTSSSPSYNSTTIPTNAGVYTVTPSGAILTPSGAAGNYSIVYETATYTINKADQLITFNAPTTPIIYGANPITLSATSNSGLAVTYTVSGPCSVSGSTITFTGQGSCVITASQTGNSNYNAATPVSHTVVINRKTLTITASSHTVAINSSAPTISPSYSGFAGTETESVLSALPSCSITGYNGAVAADYVSTCSGPGPTNGNYSITYVDGTVTVASGTVLSQTITFETLTAVTYGASPQLETATASSGLPVTFSVSGPCTLSGSTVTITGVGTCVITASQSGGTSGGNTYSSATPVSRNLVINPAPLSITATATAASKIYGGSSPTFSYSTSGLQYSDLITGATLTFTSSSPSYNSTLTPTEAGIYVLTPSSPVFGTGSASNYTISYFTTGYTISKKTLTITAASFSVTVGDSVPVVTATYNSFAGSEGVGDLTGPQTCTTTYTTTSIAGSYPTSCSGYSSSNYDIVYMPGSITASNSAPTSYTITASAGTGGSISPSGSVTVSSGSNQIFTITANSGFAISALTVNGSTVTTVSTYTFTNVITNHSISVTFASTNSNSSGNNSNNASKAPKRVAIVSLTTISTVPVKAKSVEVKENVNSQAATTPSTGGSTGANTPGSTPQPLNVNTVELSETTEIPTTDTKEISYSSNKLEKVSVVNNEVYIKAKSDFSGKTEVKITITNANDEISEITATVIVLPLPVSKQLIRPISGGSTRVVWDRSPNAVGYQVIYKDQVLCETTLSRCVINQRIPENEKVQIKSLGKDNTESLPVDATYKDATQTGPSRPATTPEPELKPEDVPAPIAKVEGVGVIPVVVTENSDKTGLDLTGRDWSIGIDSTKKLVQGNTEDSSARVVIEKGNTVTTNGTGFKPNTQVDVWVYSTPIWLGAVMTDDKGNFVTTLPMPTALPEGEHTFQAKGQTPEGLIRSASVPITLVPAVAKATKLNFSVFYPMNSFFLTTSEKRVIEGKTKEALKSAPKGAKFSVNIVGWVQPTKVSPNIQYLSDGRANAVRKYMQSLGLKGRYVLNAPGHDKINISASRRADVVITWSRLNSA